MIVFSYAFLKRALKDFRNDPDTSKAEIQINHIVIYKIPIAKKLVFICIELSVGSRGDLTEAAVTIPL